jgi:hypothetical protein
MAEIFSFDRDLLAFFAIPIIFMIFLAMFLFWPSGGSDNSRNNPPGDGVI